MQNEVFKHYTLGIPKLDQEHRDLIELMETIIKCGECQDKVNCDLSIEKLNGCFEKHLKDEEDYMEKIKYPYFEAHLEYHNVIRRELAYVISRMRDNNYLADKWTTQKLRDIFVRHIDEQDMQIVQYINKTRM